MATQRSTLWTWSLLVSCLVRPAAGFVGNAAALRLTTTESACPRTSARSRAAAAESSTLLCEMRRRRVAAGGVGGLQAAFEVELDRGLEIGSVLVAGADNYGSMTFKAVALVYEHGEGGPSRAVCVDKGLDFTIGEMSTGDLGPLSNNRLFRGGDDGGEAAIMIHPHDIMGSRPLGDTGLFVGGFVTALDLVEENKAKPSDFKFFFNHLSWPAGALQEQVGKGLWKVVRLPKDVLLETKRMRDMELWGRIEFALQKKAEQ
ncbi:unnamed protein product [Ectocarpus sp. CCAP 1310/34]|nr:unnamed protein product [Ectocarpus sp. CCAP 1310/34]